MTRLFVAAYPPEDVIEELQRFLQPRIEHSHTTGAGLRWTPPEQWHLTLAFADGVDEWRIDEIEGRFEALTRRRGVHSYTLAGAGAFPSADRAKVLHLAIGGDPQAIAALHRLGEGCRTAFAVAGAPPDGQRFTPHLTVARLARARDVSSWVRVLDTWISDPWPLEHLSLVCSHLGEGPRGRPRHEVLSTFALAGGEC